jgi:hypothetical protein
MAGGAELLIEAAGDAAVPALAGMKPVHGPHPLVPHQGIPGRIEMQGAEPLT